MIASCVTTQMRSQPVRDTPVCTPPRSLDDNYGWEGLGGQGMGCEWLAGLVWEGLGGLGMGCEWLAGLVSRVCVYVDWKGWEVWGWVVNG